MGSFCVLVQPSKAQCRNKCESTEGVHHVFATHEQGDFYLMAEVVEITSEGVLFGIECESALDWVEDSHPADYEAWLCEYFAPGVQSAEAVRSTL